MTDVLVPSASSHFRGIRRIIQRVAAITSFMALAACGADMEKVPDAEINAAHKKVAEDFGNKIMQAWAKNEYPTVGDEAIEEFRKAHNEVERQKSADKTIEDAYGNFQSMTFSSAQRSKPPKFELYVFKGTFEKGTAAVQVTLDTNGKIAGHFVRPWTD
jgi:hypothetical protein